MTGVRAFIRPVACCELHICLFTCTHSVVYISSLKMVEFLRVEVQGFADFDSVVAGAPCIFCLAYGLTAIPGHEVSFFCWFQEV